MGYWNYEHPAIERLGIDYPITRRTIVILERENGRENAKREAHLARGTALAEVRRNKTAELAERDQRNGNRPRVNDVDADGRPVPDPGVFDQAGNRIQGAKARDYMGEVDLESHRRPFFLRQQASDEAYSRFRTEPVPPSFWGDLSGAVIDWSKGAKGPFEAYAGPVGRGIAPDADAMEECSRRAIELRAEFRTVQRSLDDLKTAEAAVEANLAAVKAPFGVIVPDHQTFGPGGSRDSVRIWHNDAPLLALAKWLDPEGTRKRLLADLREKYAAEAGRLVLTPAERSKRLKTLKAELVEVELAEAWHLLGLAEMGEAVAPRSTLSPRAVLQLRPV